MKKLIAAITVSFMMLGLMTGCGAEKSFDGDILDVISFDMSKKEILENAEKEFGEIGYMSGRDDQSVEDPMKAEAIVYYPESLYGYGKGRVILRFDWNLRSLLEVNIYYEDIEGDVTEQYENILKQFTAMYGESQTEFIGTAHRGDDMKLGEIRVSMELGVEGNSNNGFVPCDIYIYIAPEEVFYPNK